MLLNTQDALHVLLIIRYWSHSHIQLDLGYPAISYPDISIIRPWSCSIYCLFSTKVLLKKEKVVKYLFYFIVYPFYMNNNLLQIE